MSNKSLARMVMKNDPGAFRIMYDEWAERIYAMAYDMLADKNLAKNAAAECFFRAWRKTSELKDESRLDAWLVAIAKQTCSDVAFSRRELSEADKEEVWKAAAARAGLTAREWESTGANPDAGNAAEEDDDWEPLIYMPTEDELIDTLQPAPYQAAMAAEIKEEPKPAPEVEPASAEPVAERPQQSHKRKREHTPKSTKVLAASLAVLAFVLLGGALVLGLASSGLIQLPESLSGAADAVKQLLSAFGG